MRGIVAVFAMARPARTQIETQTVRLALSAMPEKLSERARCKILARRVVSELIRISSPEAHMEAALSRASATLCGDHVALLVNDPAIDLAAELQRERVCRFIDRGCQQLSEEGWAAETRAIETALVERLSHRFRRLQKLAAN